MTKKDISVRDGFILGGKKISIFFLVLIIGISIGFGINNFTNNSVVADNLSLDDQEATIRVIKKAMPSIVSILVYEDVEMTYINSNGKETTIKQREKRGEGTGFVISPDGLILTNKHVVDAVYSRVPDLKVVFDDGTQFDANLIDRDPLHDLAVLKIGETNLPYLELADSDKAQVGETVIAIGNALGLYKNSATKGIISGLGRSLTAGDNAGNSESFDNLIQTDAEINLGNSGGPLLDLEGKVVGVNVAVDQSGSAIGFAIPANDVRPAVTSARATGEIIRPQLGVRYMMIDADLAEKENLTRVKGAWVVKNNNKVTVVPGSPAEKAGILPGDIIFEINAIKIEGRNNLFSVIQKYKPGDRIGLKIQRGDKVMIKIVTLGEIK